MDSNRPTASERIRAARALPLWASQDERDAQFRAITLACTCPEDAAGPWDCVDCPLHGAEAAAEVEAQHKSETDAENGWLRAAEAGYPGYDTDEERAREALDPQLNGSWRMFCSCQQIRTDPYDCAIHGEMLRRKAGL